jgi:glutamate/tyrosine decarboxylase-like PLP-dependent enzyme
MNEQLKTDLNNLEDLFEKIKQQGIDYLNKIDERKTSSNAKTEIIDCLNESGIGGYEALNLFNQKFEPLIVASTGPRYWGFVTGGSTPAATMGDMLATFYDQNTQALKGQGDISASIEIETINLLLDLFGLPNDFFGGFVTGATMSNFTSLAVARQWLGKQKGFDFAKNGITLPIRILSAAPHSSVLKSLSMLGIGSSSIEKIKVIEGNRESIDINDLKENIAQHKGEPFILIANAGTVNTVDFDNFEEIAKLKSEHNFWVHIDGAFGAFAACSPKYKHLLKGWEIADSITIDCHKWLNVPYESAFFLVKQKHNILQTETFQNSNAPYLGDPMENFNYLNFLPENSRRLKALPAWFTLKAYGKKGYQEIVENSVELAEQLGNYITNSENFELLAPVRLNNICFTLKGENSQEKVTQFLSLLNEAGKVFMTPTIYNNKKGIRASFVNWRTSKKDIAIAIEEMEKIAKLT